ncbi:hypothetical protein BC829DRAFT_203652 [Chytridium lagenaria]|nr:hypothetical protein BC829DRAFT_203652 [Chytridium lagenaria]
MLRRSARPNCILRSVGRHGSRSLSTTPDTFSHQDNIPRIPIPSLDSSCSKLLRASKTFLSSEVFATTENLVQRFTEPGGFGEALQSKLVEMEKEGKVGLAYIELTFTMQRLF